MVDLYRNVQLCLQALTGVASGLGVVPQAERSLVRFQSGHTPGFRARSPGGSVQEATD